MKHLVIQIKQVKLVKIPSSFHIGDKNSDFTKENISSSVNSHQLIYTLCHHNGYSQSFVIELRPHDYNRTGYRASERTLRVNFLSCLKWYRGIDEVITEGGDRHREEEVSDEDHDDEGSIS